MQSSNADRTTCPWARATALVELPHSFSLFPEDSGSTLADIFCLSHKYEWGVERPHVLLPLQPAVRRWTAPDNKGSRKVPEFEWAIARDVF